MRKIPQEEYWKRLWWSDVRLGNPDGEEFMPTDSSNKLCWCWARASFKVKFSGEYLNVRKVLYMLVRPHDTIAPNTRFRPMPNCVASCINPWHMSTGNARGNSHEIDDDLDYREQRCGIHGQTVGEIADIAYCRTYDDKRTRDKLLMPNGRVIRDGPEFTDEISWLHGDLRVAAELEKLWLEMPDVLEVDDRWRAAAAARRNDGKRRLNLDAIEEEIARRGLEADRGLDATTLDAINKEIARRRLNALDVYEEEHKLNDEEIQRLKEVALRASRMRERVWARRMR